MKTTGKILAWVLSILIILLGGGAIFYFQNLQSSKLIEKAVGINNTLVGAQRNTIDSVAKLDEKLTGALSKEEARGMIDSSVISVNFELEKINSLETIENSANFRTSAVELLIAYKALLESEYKIKFVNLLFDSPENITEVEYTNQVELIFHEPNTQIESLNREFLKQQIEFAKYYNLTIQ